MKTATKEYIEFFSIYEELDSNLEELFQLINSSVSEEEEEYFSKLRESLDTQTLLHDMCDILESKFSQAELSEIMYLYRKYPVLTKVLKYQSDLSAAMRSSAENMIKTAAERVPYVMSGGIC